MCSLLEYLVLLGRAEHLQLQGVLSDERHRQVEEVVPHLMAGKKKEKRRKKKKVENVWDTVPFSRIPAIFPRSIQCWTTLRQAFPYDCMGGKVEFGPKNVCFRVPNNFGQDCRSLLIDYRFSFAVFALLLMFSSRRFPLCCWHHRLLPGNNTITSCHDILIGNSNG